MRPHSWSRRSAAVHTDFWPARNRTRIRCSAARSCLGPPRLSPGLLLVVTSKTREYPHPGRYGGVDPFADVGSRPARPFLLLREGRRGMMSTDTRARLARIREIRENGGRLTAEQFHERIYDAEVVSELTRRALWRGDGRLDCSSGTPRDAEVTPALCDRGSARSALDGESDRGFTFDDLWMFYCRCNSPKLIAANNEKSRNGKRLIESARVIRQALRAFRWTQKVRAATPRWFLDLATDPRGDARRFDDRPMIVGDLETAILAYARDLERVGKCLLRGGRRANGDERLFRSQWAQFAMKRAGEPLDSIGVRLFEILFGKHMETDSYRRQRIRDASTSRETKRLRTSTTPRPVRTKQGQTRADLSGQKPSRKVTRRRIPPHTG